MYLKKIKKILFYLTVLLCIELLYDMLNPNMYYSKDELIKVLYSPDKSKKLCIYQGPPEDSIMVDFYVVGVVDYTKRGFKKDVIYNEYHCTLESAAWLDNTHVEINERVIDISNRDTWIKKSQ